MLTYVLGYHVSWSALASPGSARDFFKFGRPASEDALCAELSRLVYVDDTRARNEALERGGFNPDRAQFFDRDGMQAMLLQDPAGRFLVFRGTEPDSPADLAADLTFMRARTGGGGVHAGFLAGLDKLWPAIAPALDRSEGRLVYAGHSLGAALAVVAMARRAPAAVVTLGCPRVGDAAFVAGLPDVPHRRWVHCADLVARLPPEGIGFRHAGTRHYIDHDGNARPGIGDAAIAADRKEASAAYPSLYRLLTGDVPSRKAADHAPINYVSALLDERP